MSFDRKVLEKIPNHQDSTATMSSYFRGYSLSNIPKNMARLKYNVDDLLTPTMLLFFAYLPFLVSADYNDNKVIYFSDHTQQTGYKLVAASDASEVITRVEQGDCNVLSNVTSGPLDYEILQTKRSDNWRLLAQLSRGLHQPPQPETEECLKKMIETVVKAILDQQDANIAKIFEIAGGIVGGLLLIGCLFVTVSKLVDHWETANSNPQINSNSSAVDVETGEQDSLLEKDELQSKQQFESTKQKEKEKTNEDRLTELTKYGFDFTKIPKEYICPISLLVMDNPVLLANGTTVDQSAVDKALAKDKNAKNFFTRKDRLDQNIAPNLAVKSLIGAYVQKQEKKYNKKDNNETLSTQTQSNLFTTPVGAVSQTNTNPNSTENAKLTIS